MQLNLQTWKQASFVHGIFAGERQKIQPNHDYVKNGHVLPFDHNALAVSIGLAKRRRKSFPNLPAYLPGYADPELLGDVAPVRPGAVPSSAPAAVDKPKL